MTLVVYALVSPAPRRLGMRGVAGERLEAVTVGRVSAIVGQAARHAKPTEANLRAYDRLMRRLTQATTAVLPVRFGSTFHGLDELTFVLESRQTSLRQLLRHVRNRAQMTIRMVTVPAAAPLPPAPTRTTHARATGASYLRAIADDAARGREVAGFDPIRSAVKRWVKDERVERRQNVATVYHLIPRGAAAAYRAALDRAVLTAGSRVVVSGPWPPYAFTTSV